jgi:hypothetical protein
MNISNFVIISLFLSSTFQFIYGFLSIIKKTSLSFKKIYLISITSQLILSIIVYLYYLTIFSENFDKCGNRIVNLQLGLLFCGIVLICIILFQLVIKYIITKQKNK